MDGGVVNDDTVEVLMGMGSGCTGYGGRCIGMVVGSRLKLCTCHNSMSEFRHLLASSL